MEAIRKPSGLGKVTEISPLELQIHLGEMEQSQGPLLLEQAVELRTMREIAVGQQGQIEGLETPEKIHDATRPRPIMDDFSANKAILLSM